MIHEGDCVEVMVGLEECSVSAIVTDPPYGIGFMGKVWDGPAIASAARRDAETRKSLGPHSESRPNRAEARSSSAFGSAAHYAGPVRGGHPWQAWCETWAREALRVAKPGAHLLAFGGTRTYHRLVCAIEDAGWEIRDCLVWAYASGFPKSLNLPGGLGTALKPAWEPIVLARKPLRGTVAANVASYGTGTLNIDGTRIPSEPVHTTRATALGVLNDDGWQPTPGVYASPEGGRWPPNLLLTDPIFDGDTPGVMGGGATSSGSRSGVYSGGGYHGDWPDVSAAIDGDSGTYSRFFLIPKADRTAREPVLLPDGHDRSKRFTTHPTVKPVELMRHLVRLVTPPRGVVLDPFLGSGTTAIAAEMEGFPWIGIEKEPEYVAIARARLNGTQRGLGLVG